jgi:hypothetical protein
VFLKEKQATSTYAYRAYLETSILMGVSLECYRAAIGLFNCGISVVSTVNFSFVFFNIMGPYQNVNLKIAHLNIRSLNAPNKFGEIASAILNHKFDLFALSETWLNDSISNDLFSIPGYCPLIRLGRSDGRRSGGVAVYSYNFNCCQK